MCPRSFICEEAKIKERIPLKKEPCEIDGSNMGIPIHILFTLLAWFQENGSCENSQQILKYT